MDFHKLKAFIVVAENLNFRKSAEILGMSQPPLTRLIAALEEELDTDLFERTTRSVRLTGPGVLLLKEAREIVSALERIEKEVRSTGKIKKGSLKIAFSPTVFLARFPTIMNEFKERFPKLHTELIQESKTEILKGVENGRFDIGFLDSVISHKDLQARVVQDERMGVLVQKQSKLAKEKEISFRDLKNETLILHPKSDAPEFHERISKMMRSLAHTPKIYIKGQNESCPILVATGKGVSLTIAGARGFAPQETVFVPVRDLFLPVSVFWNQENQNPTLNVFLGFVFENASLKKSEGDCLMSSTAFQDIQ